jgi:6-phosphogluconolactonase
METAGKHPCYVSLNHNNKSIAFANYSSGNIGFVEVNENGGFKSDIQVKQHKGKGTLLPNQEKPHAHCTKFYKNNFLYAVDLGIDKVLKYTIDNNEMIKSEIVLESKNGDGFRHLIFHPTKNISYLVNEFSNSVIVSQIENETGAFKKIQQVSTLPKGYEKESFAADVQISNDGKFLYVSNRGQNSIVVFSVDKEGKLTFITTESVRGNWPRNFMLTKDNNFLLVANQFSNNIVVFKRDKNTGMLEYTGNQLEMSLPVFLSEL